MGEGGREGGVSLTAPPARIGGDKKAINLLKTAATPPAMMGPTLKKDEIFSSFFKFRFQGRDR